MLEDDAIVLRGVEPEDVDFLFQTENNTKFWKVSDTLIPFSKSALKRYAEALHDITQQKQYRFVIHDKEKNVPVGMLDLFDYNAVNRRAMVGIIIASPEVLGKGLAKRALILLEQYAIEFLNLKQLACCIQANNERSRLLFEGVGYNRCGERKDWYINKEGEFISELLFQKILR